MQDEKIDFSIFAGELRRRMKEFGLTQARLGKLAGMSQPTVGRCLNGYAPRVEHLFALARALESSMEELLTGEAAGAAAEEGGTYRAGRKGEAKMREVREEAVRLQGELARLVELLDGVE